MTNKFLLLFPSVLLLACDPIGRMTGNPSHRSEPVVQQSVKERFEGDLRHANYVELPMTSFKSIEVFLKHNGSWIRLERLEEMEKGKDPYYLLSVNDVKKDLTVVIFQNETYTDLYSIEVTR